eukprot:TRINITY_DN2898_c0_g1_i1.p1 TRINITY_DN2898_c0_g1~~TRINITY_DN2898_c0_g1_i1.p1  ORF type:complete len:137 (-),score=4.76 TRINITY_DN2898_c0_g1_i1:1079-1489(-)
MHEGRKDALRRLPLLLIWGWGHASNHDGEVESVCRKKTKRKENSGSGLIYLFVKNLDANILGLSTICALSLDVLYNQKIMTVIAADVIYLMYEGEAVFLGGGVDRTHWMAKVDSIKREEEKRLTMCKNEMHYNSKN